MPFRRYIYPGLTLLLGLVWIILSAENPAAARANRIFAPQRGFYAPGFSLTTLDGDTISLAQVEGQPLLINIWASWCGPCRAEMPAIERVYQAYREQGFQVLAINATNQDSIEAATAFVAQYGLTFPIMLDREGRASQAYQLRALPSTFFVGRDGVIQEVVIGGPMSEALLRTRVETLLAETP